MKNSAVTFLRLFSGLFLMSSTCYAADQEARIKDLVNIRGVRSNQLTGAGLVVGLNLTGDSPKSVMTNRAAAEIVSRLGVKVTSQEMSGGSAAVVMVTAEMPPFSRNGDHIDARVSILGDAKSLAGGVLVNTPLKSADGTVYGFVHGPVVVGQANGLGPRVLTVATIPGGLTIEREFTPVIDTGNHITLSLRKGDFTTNHHIVEAVNRHLRGFYAKSVDVNGIDVEVPQMFQDRLVEFISEIEGLKVAVDQKSVVIINERTGTVVMGGDVMISPVTISHGELSIAVGGKGGGGAGKKDGKAVVNMGGATVGKLVESMNALGMKPADLVGVMQAVQAAGALHAELQFM